MLYIQIVNIQMIGSHVKAFRGLFAHQNDLLFEFSLFMFGLKFP